MIIRRIQYNYARCLVEKHTTFGHWARLMRQCILFFSILATAFAGTLSPQFTGLDPNQPVQVIVQYTPGFVGTFVEFRLRSRQSASTAAGPVSCVR